MSVSVLHVSRSVAGGVGRVVADLATDQVDRGWRVAVACPPGQLADEVVAVGARHVEWAARREVRSFPGEVRSLARVVREYDPDVVHLHSAKAGLAGRLAMRGTRPTIYQPHGWPFTLGGATDAGARSWERIASRWADVTVCVSESEATRGRAVGITGRFEVIQNGVDLGRFPAADEGERARARATLGLSSGPLAVCVGRVCRQKAQDVLLDSWPSVTAVVPGATLVIVGDGPLREDLEARGTAGVRWLGQRDDVVEWLLASDVVTQPSRWEGMAVTVLEAMAARRCVVATDCDGMVEAVGVGANAAGRLVGVDQVDQLADALRQRLTDPDLAAREGLVGRARVEQHFDRRRVNDEVADLVLSLVPTSRR